jgi:hypothetical protein
MLLSTIQKGRLQKVLKIRVKPASDRVSSVAAPTNPWPGFTYGLGAAAKLLIGRRADPPGAPPLHESYHMKSLTRTVVALLAFSVPAVTMAETPAPGAPDVPRIKVHKIKPVPVRLPAAKRDKLARASKKAKPFPFEGEQLFYSVEVSGADAARASLQVGKKKTKKGVTYVPIAGRAISHGFFAKSYPLDNKADTYIDLSTGQPFKADKIIKENGSFRRYNVRFNPDGYSASVDKELRNKGEKKTKKRQFLRAVPGAIHDGLSWIYALRGEKLAKGDKYTYYIYDGWKLSKLVVTVVGKETAWTPLKEYKTIKVDIERTILNSRWKGKKGTKGNRGAPKLSNREKPYYFSSIYFSDDALHIPVKVFVTSQKADSELKLVKYVAPTGK